MNGFANQNRGWFSWKEIKNVYKKRFNSCVFKMGNLYVNGGQFSSTGIIVNTLLLHNKYSVGHYIKKKNHLNQWAPLKTRSFALNKPQTTNAYHNLMGHQKKKKTRQDRIKKMKILIEWNDHKTTTIAINSKRRDKLREWEMVLFGFKIVRHFLQSTT